MFEIPRILLKNQVFFQKVINKIHDANLKVLMNWEGRHCQQQAVLRDGGISPAETAVRTWKLLTLRNISKTTTSPCSFSLSREQIYAQWTMKEKIIGVCFKRGITATQIHFTPVNLTWRMQIY